MGLLDDAIREHLDLKRRRGADPTEVERAEREALGPVRRPQASEEDDLQLAHADNEVFVDDDEEFLEEPLPADRGAEPYGEPEDGWTYEDEAERLDEPVEPPPEQHTALYTPDFGDDEPAGHSDPEVAPKRTFAPEPAAPPEPGLEPLEPGPEPEPRQASPRPHPAGGETFEYDAPAEGAGEPVPEGEDVLEETPEFLQDTPDHDRLWFEQRPPKDFDFDG